MRSPVLAMLWEHWRLTRLEAAQRLSVGLVAGSAALAFISAAANERVRGAGATVAVALLLTQHAPIWLSIAKLNGGRFLDGYKPGFPLYLFYTRPVRTAVIVGVAMAYDAVSCAALYLVSAAVLGLAFGQPLPLLPLAVWIAAFHLAQFSYQYSTRNRVVQWLGAGVIGVLFFAWLMFRADVSPLPAEFSDVRFIGWLMFRADWSPLQVEFSLADYALMASIGLVSFALAVAGVARQRRGDAVAGVPRTARSAGHPHWLANVFRFPCPTSSATRAQVWFELKSSGLPVLTIGVALAFANPLLFAVTGQIDAWLSGFYARPAALVVAMFSVPTVLILGGNAFGIRARQGRTYASVFEATQAYGTARMAGLKVLVRSVCVLVALVAAGASVWASLSFIPFDVLDDDEPLMETNAPLSSWVRAIEGPVGAMSADQQLALAFVTSIVVAVMVGWRAADAAFRTRYRRRQTIAGSLVLLYTLALVLLTRAGERGIGPEIPLGAILEATKWIGAAAMVLATVYLFGIVLSERLLTLRQLCGAILVSAAFGVAWVTVLRAVGVSLGGMPTTDAAWMLSPALLPLLVSVLAPWSLSRVRHT